MFSPLMGTQHLISLACTAPGNANKVWQNLRHDKARPAIGLGCQSTKAKSVAISQQNTAPGLVRSRSSMGRLIISSCFRALLHADTARCIRTKEVQQLVSDCQSS